MNVTFSSPKTPMFECIICDFKTCNKKDYTKHSLTLKHKKRSSVTNCDGLVTEKSQKTHFQCENCSKVYNSRNGIWLHKKKCTQKYDTTPEQPNNVIIELLKQNQEFKDLIIEQNKQILELAGKVGANTTNNTNCNNTNNTNNHFNLQFFLNEQCKDALNIMDFINQLQLNTSDLDMVGRLGYAEGISKIFIRGLKELDIFKRPLHCSDLKREVVYVKDKDAWEKDGEDKKAMKNAIKFIAAKNFNQLTDWIEDNPEYNDYDSKKHKEYHNIILKASGGATPEEDEKNYNKIIRNVAQESVIDKSGDK